MFGKRLVAVRKQKGISQYKLAADLGLSRGQIANYEVGSREPDFETLLTIASYFDVTTDYLLGVLDEIQPENSKPNDDLEEWKEIIEVASELGLKPEHVKQILFAQNEIAKIMNKT